MIIIFEGEAGGCSIVVPNPDSGLTMDELAASVVPSGVPYRIVEDTEIPTDRTYRDAWEVDLAGGRIIHNMAKARDIHKDHMRRVRKPLLEALDQQYLRADERRAAGNADKAQVAAQKQALREVTRHAGIVTASTPEELKAVWPAELGVTPLR